MRKLLLFGILFAVLLTAAAPAASVPAARRAPDLATADELINAVNALRAANGLVLSTGGSVAISTPSTPAATIAVPTSTRYGAPTPTILPNTPNADGSIIHVARQGDTLYGIAFAYNVLLDDILALNGLTIDSSIFVGQKIYIRAAFTATATLPTSTPTRFPTSTLWPTSTATVTVTPLPPATATPVRSAGLPLTATAGIVGLIVLLAMGGAALLALAGRKK
jgi:LysM repeat protein